MLIVRFNLWSVHMRNFLKIWQQLFTPCIIIDRPMSCLDYFFRTGVAVRFMTFFRNVMWISWRTFYLKRTVFPSKKCIICYIHDAYWSTGNVTTLQILWHEVAINMDEAFVEKCLKNSIAASYIMYGSTWQSFSLIISGNVAVIMNDSLSRRLFD